MTEVETRVVQVTNLSPSVSKEQLQNFFDYVGRVKELKVFPEVDNHSVPTKVAFVKYDSTESVKVALHLTNTVMVDHAMIVRPHVDNTIPEEASALRAAAPSNAVAGMLPPTVQWPTNVVSMICGTGSTQNIQTLDPKLAELGLAPYPPLPGSTDPSKIEEIRRTVYATNLEPAVTAEQLVQFFSQAGEVRYVRMAGEECMASRSAYIEFSNQRSVPKALSFTGFVLNGLSLKVAHSLTIISNKPQTKSEAAVAKEIDEAMKRVKDAQHLITAAVGGHNRSHDRKRRSRSRNRSRQRSRSRRRSRDRDRDRDRDRKRRNSRSPSRGRRYKSRSPTRSYRGSRRSRTPSRGVKAKEAESRRRSRSRHRSKSRTRRRSRSPRDRRRSRSKDRGSRRSRERKRSRSRGKKRSRSRDHDQRSSKDDKRSSRGEAKPSAPSQDHVEKTPSETKAASGETAPPSDVAKSASDGDVAKAASDGDVAKAASDGDVTKAASDGGDDEQGEASPRSVATDGAESPKSVKEAEPAASKSGLDERESDKGSEAAGGPPETAAEELEEYGPALDKETTTALAKETVTPARDKSRSLSPDRKKDAMSRSPSKSRKKQKSSSPARRRSRSDSRSKSSRKQGRKLKSRSRSRGRRSKSRRRSRSPRSRRSRSRGRRSRSRGRRSSPRPSRSARSRSRGRRSKSRNRWSKSRGRRSPSTKRSRSRDRRSRSRKRSRDRSVDRRKRRGEKDRSRSPDLSKKRKRDSDAKAPQVRRDYDEEEKEFASQSDAPLKSKETVEPHGDPSPPRPRDPSPQVTKEPSPDGGQDMDISDSD